MGRDMTEEQWSIIVDPQAMLTFLQDSASPVGQLSCRCCRVRCSGRVGICPTYRKLRLLTIACCSRIMHVLTDSVCQAAFLALTHFVEQEIDANSYANAVTEFDQVRRRRYPKYETPDDGAWNALYCSVHRKWWEY